MLWRKLTLGPAGSATCRKCGHAVGADSAKSLLAWMPASLIVVIPVIALVYTPLALLIPLVMLPILSLLLSLFWVPLVITELSTPETIATGIANAAQQKRRAISS